MQDKVLATGRGLGLGLGLGYDFFVAAIDDRIWRWLALALAYVAQVHPAVAPRFPYDRQQAAQSTQHQASRTCELVDVKFL